jgi:hypothetical protein
MSASTSIDIAGNGAGRCQRKKSPGSKEEVGTGGLPEERSKPTRETFQNAFNAHVRAYLSALSVGHNARPRPSRCAIGGGEPLQFGTVRIGDRGKVHIFVAPDDDIEATDGCVPFRWRGNAGRSPREDINDVAVQSVDNRYCLAIPDAIESCTQEIEPLRGQVSHGRRKFKPTLKPGAYHMAIGGRDVDMGTRWCQRRDVPGYRIFRKRLERLRLR